MVDLHHSPSRYIMRVSAGLLHRLDSFVEGGSMTPQEARMLQFIAAARGPVQIIPPSGNLVTSGSFKQ